MFSFNGCSSPGDRTITTGPSLSLAATENSNDAMQSHARALNITLSDERSPRMGAQPGGLPLLEALFRWPDLDVAQDFNAEAPRAPVCTIVPTE